ncbi:glycosyltransferase [Chryseobacterium sp. GMJ5]|uniref:Glycosyltransferase n=1 Tax=Chryseobacterium gilvum TaxID=2976534 RepID=A0ABT2VYJ2_9FLAO|nr:glycosyltransferase [Chryseobacterium gilvum]MCU7615071.1 glycosyltransferase [Chryseobacterium gilvum]
MKILHAITLADLGGAQSVLINICNNAALEGHDVYVVSEANGPMWKQLDKNITQIKIPQLQREINIKKDFSTLIALRKIYKKIKPDVVHLHSSKIGVLGRLAFPVHKIIYTVHGFDSVRIANRKFLVLEKLLKNKAKFIVAVSKYDREKLALEGIRKNVKMIYNGINDADLHILPFDLTSEYLKNIHDKHIVVMTIARLSPPKRYDLFCSLAAHFVHDERFHFIWIGNKQGKGDNSQNITMMGELINASAYLKYAHLFLLPSNYEGLPISILEAMCCEIPVIASNVGGISEILNNKNGFAVENEVKEFEEAIRKIMVNKETYKTYSEEARLKYEKEFTISKMYEKYIDLYKQC